MNLTLEHRRGLPEALQVLLKEHPREAWEADPNFNGLISFWLDRHMMFRKLGAIMLDEAKTLLDGRSGADHFARAVNHYGGTFVNQLHGHHQMEDHHYFPVLMTRDSRVERGFEMLDADHHALDGHLNAFVEAANDAIKGMGNDPKVAASGFLDAVTELDGLLRRHLDDEEDLIVPVILKYGTEGLG
jgi:hemerythrin-like domain-containing protein